MKIEYRVKAVERYIITRYEEDETGSSVVERGMHSSPHIAYEVAYALASAEHQRLGWAFDDPRIKYPDGDPRYADAKPVTA